MSQLIRVTVWEWLHRLWDSAVQGGAGAALAAMGLAGASTMGVPVQALDYKQTAAIFLSGAALEVLRYLKTTPSPNIEGHGDESSIPSHETDKPL